jgi:hypothetical protein
MMHKKATVGNTSAANLNNGAAPANPRPACICGLRAEAA